MRFAYEVAKEIMDARVSALNNNRLKRVWFKLQLELWGLAIVDYDAATDREKAIACAWEHLQIALAGHGTEDLTGSVILLYRVTRPEDREALQASFVHAFERAENATPKRTKRLFSIAQRSSHFRSLEEKFDQACFVPLYGPHLIEWADARGLATEDIEKAVALLLREHGDLTTTKGSHLRLV